MPPSDELLAKCCRVGKDHNAPLVTLIFQTTNMDEAACRAISSRWIGANLPETFHYSKSISEQLEQGHVLFVKAQEIQVETFRLSSGLAEALEESDELANRAEQIQRMPTFAPQFLLRKKMEAAELEEDLDEHKRKLTRTFRRYNALLGSGGVRRKIEHYVQSGHVFNSDEDITARFTCEGFYLMGLKSTNTAAGHALAFYYSTSSECRFLDANTGEWAFSNPAALKYFFKDYMLTMYERKYDGRVTSFAGFAAQLSDRKHRRVGDCPFAICPLEGIISNCPWEDRGVSEVRIV